MLCFNVMLRRVNFYCICFATGLSVILILAGSLYLDKVNYRSSFKPHENIRDYLETEGGEYILLQLISTNPRDRTPNIEKILDKTRSKIRLELLNYNFANSGVNKLEDLLMESGGKPIRSIIISTWRSGSTFFGDVLNAMPSNFYQYEPLRNNDNTRVKGSPHAEKAIRTIKSMLKCDYSGIDDYFEFKRTHLHQFTYNTRLWDICKYNTELCFDADFTSNFCKLFPFHSMKLVRLRLSYLEDILNNNDFNAKVVLLIRDPRGVMQSRQHQDFCRPAPDCWQPELLCADMISDYVAAGHFLQKYPDRFMILRFEELALSPNMTSRQLYKFLRLSPTRSLDEFLQTHTSVDAGGLISTYRMSQDVPFKWKHSLDFDYVAEIQEACKEAMGLWGYRIAHNSSHMESKDFYPIEPFSIKLLKRRYPL